MRRENVFGKHNHTKKNKKNKNFWLLPIIPFKIPQFSLFASYVYRILLLPKHISRYRLFVGQFIRNAKI